MRNEKELERAVKKICTSGVWHKAKVGYLPNGQLKNVHGEAGRIFEALLGIQPNNKQGADIVLGNGTMVEIKTNKSPTTKITLGCKAPIRIKKQKDTITIHGKEEANVARRLNATLKVGGGPSRTLVAECKGSGIAKTIDVSDSETGNREFYWVVADVVKKFTNKIPNVLHVKAIKRKVGGREEYKFVSSTYYSKFNPHLFEKQLTEDGRIVIEPREKIDYTNNNRIRDRGTAFRTDQESVNEMFNKSVTWC